MKATRFWAALSGLAFVLACGTAANATDLPHRKPGHWKVTMGMPMSGGTRTIDTCIKKGDDFGAQPGGASKKADANCSKPKVVNSGGTVTSSVTCNVHGKKQTIVSTFTGDFQSSYHGTVKMKMDPPMQGMNGFDMTVDAKYIGPDCPKNAISVPH